MSEQSLVVGWSPVCCSDPLVVRVEKGEHLVACVIIRVKEE